MSKEFNAYLLGGGIGSLAAAAFMIRDSGLPGKNIFILEAKSDSGRESLCFSNAKRWWLLYVPKNAMYWSI